VGIFPFTVAHAGMVAMMIGVFAVPFGNVLMDQVKFAFISAAVFVPA